MSDRVAFYERELKELIDEGRNLEDALKYEFYKDVVREQLLKVFEGDETRTNNFIKKLPVFGNKYQTWYSKSLAVIKQVLPDRLADFISYFEPAKNRKEVTFQSYMIRDYLQGLRITRGYPKEVLVDGSAAIPEFAQQLQILIAARDSLKSRLMDLTATLQADLFDSEVEAARSLAKSGFLRAAGAMCGVLIEKHLLYVCQNHNVAPTKKNPGISDLIQKLREADVITVAQWRFIQSLADTRNLCGHAKEREPTKNEIEDLLSGTERILKQVY